MGSFYDKKATGTVFTSINKKELESLKIKVPASYDDQKRIADRLATLDRKIHLNQQLNANLANRYQLKYLINKLFLIAFSLLFSFLFWNIFLNMGVIVMLKLLILSSLIFGIKRFPICFG